jgi:hypothetical protein
MVDKKLGGKASAEARAALMKSKSLKVSEAFWRGKGDKLRFTVVTPLVAEHGRLVAYENVALVLNKVPSFHRLLRYVECRYPGEPL